MESESNKVLSMSSRPQRLTKNGGNGGRELEARLRAVEERLARVETGISHLATKEGLQKLETLIVKRESNMMKWLIGIISVSLVSVIAALIRTFLG